MQQFKYYENHICIIHELTINKKEIVGFKQVDVLINSPFLTSNESPPSNPFLIRNQEL